MAKLLLLKETAALRLDGLFEVGDAAYDRFVQIRGEDEASLSMILGALRGVAEVHALTSKALADMLADATVWGEEEDESETN